ncbi:MAG TPA: BadF/BadG/BcrA/BcrD ATPase family protein [Gaiellaceae bacterium]|nr:BadF/BadG/BcrA/BcrD ATPase family protein [Gaiellaceae bacterium]
MSDPLFVAVDGGGSKTDLVLARASGQVLSVARGPRSSPQLIGLDGSLEVLDALLAEASGPVHLNFRDGSVAELAQLLVAGVDFPSEENEFREAVERRGWARRTLVGNDTFAVLRAGTERGWGIAVVCGAGINCVGVAPDGRHARFPALGAITGDWGGGYDLGIAAVSAAARSEDGRGPRTALEQAVPAHFGLSTPQELAEAFHRGGIPLQRADELPKVVFAAAATDEVAAGIVDRLALEVVALARVALRRLELEGQPVEILLGGGLLQARDGRLTRAIEDGLDEVDPQAVVRIATSPPIVGAALLALDELGAPAEAQERLRRELGEEVDRLDGERSAAGG